MVFALSAPSALSSDELAELKLDFQVTYQALPLYRMHCNSFPTEKEGLQALLRKDASSCKNWQGPYAEARRMVDPWGQQLRLSVEGKTARLTSAGPDKAFDTADDLHYPDQAREDREEIAEKSPTKRLGFVLQAIQMYHLHCKHYPLSADGLAALVEKPSGDCPGWKGPYLKRELLRDSNGTSFRYGTKADGGFQLTAAGDDKKFGTKDDILYPPAAQ